MQLRYKDKVLGGSSNVPTTNPTSEQLINAPIGSIMGWTDPDNIPQGWHICDGTEGTYDLRGKFILGASENHAVGETGGSEEVSLTVEQMPSHTHTEKNKNNTTAKVNNISDGSYTLVGSTTSTINTGSTGGSQPHPNMPPYIVLIFIQKIGVTPTDYVTEERVDEKIEEALANQNGSDNSDGVPSGFIGMWSGAIVPNGWALCDGTNGTPDLRGRFVLGASTSHSMGSIGGSEEVSLTVEQMPRHDHVERTSSINPDTGENASATLVETIYGLQNENFGEIFATNDTNNNSVRTTSSVPGSVKTKETGGYIDAWTGETISVRPHSNMPPYYVLAYIMKL